MIFMYQLFNGGVDVNPEYFIRSSKEVPLGATRSRSKSLGPNAG